MKSTHCLCFTVLAFGTGACVKPVSIEGMPCPCAESQGYTCCATTNQCLPTGQACQADAGRMTDVAIERIAPVWTDTGATTDVAIEQIAPVWTDAGQSKWQPIASSGPLEMFMPSEFFLMGDRVAILDLSGMSVPAYRFAQNDWLQMQGQWPGHFWLPGLVWTGSQVVYWGGLQNAYEGCKCNSLGGVYSPATDTWSAIDTTGAPALGVDGSGFTGREVVLRGNSCIPQPSGDDLRGPMIGALYAPATDSWRVMSTVNAPTTTDGTDVVLGEKVVCWGGVPYVEGKKCGPPLNQPSGWTNSGAVYNAADDTWTAMSTANSPSPRSGPHYGMLVLAMRGKMFVWGGIGENASPLNDPTTLRDGGIFDPETNTWTSISKEGSPPGSNGLTALWAEGLWAEEQGLAYVWSPMWTSGDVSPYVALWTYDPSADQWASVDVTGLPRMQDTYFVWTGRDLLAIGLLDADSTATPTMGGFRYTP